MKLIVVTPETTVLDTDVEFVALPLFDGEMGIAPKHSPMIGRLGFGEMRLKSATGPQRFYVDGGFVQVASDVVSVLTNRCVKSGDLKVDVAEQQLEAANHRKANTPELLAIRDRLVSQAQAQLRTARRAK